MKLTLNTLLGTVVAAALCQAGSMAQPAGVPTPKPVPAPPLALAQPGMGAAHPSGPIPVPNTPVLKTLELGEGLIAEELKIGDGEEVKPGASVTVYYHGTLKDGTVFDSAFQRGTTNTFTLGQVIEGWNRGLPGMKVGGIRRIIIPAKLAYGERGQPPVIGPNADLVFLVQMVGTKAPAARDPNDLGKCMGPDGKEHSFPLKVYDESADAKRTIDDGIAKAKAEGKRVLAMWGENMCQFCLFLEDILANDPQCKPLVKSEYVWIRIDLGREYAKGNIKNLQLAEFFGLTHFQVPKPDGKTMGAPALCIIDPETGRTVGQMDPARDLLTGVMGGNDMVAKPMTMNRLFDEKVIYEFLATHKPPAKDATAVMADAQARAKRDSKKLLALFVIADEESERFSNWLLRPGVTAALWGSFVPVLIDVDRMNGGTDLLKTTAGKPVLPPMLTVLEADGKAASGAAQFTAFPKTDAEIEAFVNALASAAKLGDADKRVLTKSLKDAALAAADKK